jgi:hypothetical protein
MGMLKPGDKVKFLNDRGGGIVSRIIDSRMVGVSVEGGFELPTLVSELIRIEPDDAAGRFFDEQFIVQGGTVEEKTAIPDDRQSDLSPEVKRQRKSEELLLAFVPHDQKWLVTGILDVMLINNTGFDVLFNLLLKNENGEYFGRDYGSVFHDTSVVLDTIDRDALPAWSEGAIQFLFHSDAPGRVYQPFNAEYRISGKKFFQEGNYRESQYFQGKGILVKVLSLTDYVTSKKQKESKDPGKKVPGEDPQISRHRIAAREAEVDLHIHELVEDSTNLDPSEIIEIQKSYFTRCMESAIAEHYQKVFFIHGVGNGVLKAILLELLEKYEGIEIFDAPMAKYGRGAVEIRLPHNMNPVT